MITMAPTFKGLLAEAFDQIRGNTTGNVAVMARMLGALHTIGSLTTDQPRRKALHEQVQWIAELADHSIASTHDRARIERRLMEVREALEAWPALCAREAQAN